MKVLILAAGYGTRLYPVVKDTPKPLLEVAGRPLIDYLFDKILPLGGLKEVLVVTNEKFYPDFSVWAEGKKDTGVPVTVVNDGTTSPEDRLGSVGDIHFVCTTRGMDDDLLVLGGDNLFDYDLGGYLDFARQKVPAVSIGLFDIGRIKEAKKFGVVAVDGTGKVTSFEEKPENPQSSLVAMCFYYFPRAAVPLVKEYVAESGKTDKAGDYIRWLSEHKEVYGFKFQGKWYDIGSPESYREAQKNFNQST